MKKCLIVCPLHFYNWHSAIGRELERRGYEVSLKNDEHPNSTFGAFLGICFNKLSQELTYNNFKNFFQCSDNKFDLVVIFKGRGFSSKLIDLIDSNSTRVIAYNFDSYGYFSGFTSWMHKVDSFKTFDFKDSEIFNIERVDLFSDYEFKGKVQKKYDISCIMKNHSNRLKYLDDIYEFFKNELKFKVYIVEKNILTYIIGVIKNPVLFWKWRNSISFNSLNSEEFFKEISLSKFTIDFAHPTQTGLTMRTYQSLAAGTKIISNNTYLDRAYIPDKNSYFIHNDKDKLIFLAKYIKTHTNVENQNFYRSISNFIDDLLL